mmetsp:Transcript_27178/g.84567  ORF Transcript_27178/g.84567 Transcript_27178/m.84567 type:complete len:380 (+) Transcript_27178:182-1321(+)
MLGDPGAGALAGLHEVGAVATEEVQEVRVREVVPRFEEAGAASLELLLPPRLQRLILERVGVDLEGERVGRLELVVGPVQARARARVAHLLARGTEGALAVVLVDVSQDLEHRAAVPCGHVLTVVGPGHVEAARAAVHRKEGRGSVVRHELPEDAGLGLAEGIGARVGLHAPAGLPLLVPVAVEVHAVGVHARAEGAVLHLFPRAGVAVEDHLEFAVPQDLRRAPGAVALSAPAEDAQEVEAGLRADQLAAVLAKEDEDLVRGVAVLRLHRGDVDAHTILADGPHGEGAALGRELPRGPADFRARVVPWVEVFHGLLPAVIVLQGRGGAEAQPAAATALGEEAGAAARGRQHEVGRGQRREQQAARWAECRRHFTDGGG